MAIVDGHGYPIALHIESASPGEATLVEKTVEAKIIADLPPRLIGDKAYDSDGLDKKMTEEYHIEMIAPNRRNRGKTPRMADSCGGINDGGKSKDSFLGSKAIVI